jgi:tRNA-splicing ligase RtcB (3'-phosphate/5'-hydroxy nucleic acid ligase)
MLPALRPDGQPVLIGGSMGTGSYILVGERRLRTKRLFRRTTARALSRHVALKQWSGRKVVDDLAERGIIIMSPSMRGVAEETPGAYKDVAAVLAAAEPASLARRVARLRPLICIKG